MDSRIDEMVTLPALVLETPGLHGVGSSVLLSHAIDDGTRPTTTDHRTTSDTAGGSSPGRCTRWQRDPWGAETGDPENRDGRGLHRGEICIFEGGWTGLFAFER